MFCDCRLRAGAEVLIGKGYTKKKSCTSTWGCFILIRSHGPPPSPILPRNNHKTKHRPYAYIWPKSSIWPPLHLSSHNHPPEMRPQQVKVTLYDISICCNKILVIRLQFTSSAMKQIFILDNCPISFT